MRRASVSPKITRAVHAQYSAVTTTITPNTPWPSTLASARPEMTVGTERKISVIRISTVSTIPRRKPATTPTIAPTPIEVALAMNATSSVVRPP